MAIAPGAKQTLEDVKKLLKPDRDVVERRAAAKALRRLSESLPAQQGDEGEAVPGIAPQRGRSVLGQRPAAPPTLPPIERERLPSRMQKSVAALVTAAGLGLSDQKDATVRLLCLETIRQAIQQSLQITEHREVSRPLAAAVSEQTPAVIALLDDADTKDCLAAIKSWSRSRLAAYPCHLLGREDERFLPPPEKRPAEETKLLDGILEMLPTLKRSLANKEVRVRLAALRPGNDGRQCREGR